MPAIAATSTRWWRAACGGCSRLPSATTAPRSTRTRCSISRTCCCTRCGCSGRWRSSRRAATGWNRAITTCSWTSSRTRAGRSGSWCRCWCGRGAKAPGLAYQGPLEPTVFIVGDRKQSIYGFRDADVAVLGEAGPRHRPAAARRRRAALDFAQLPVGAGAAGVRQRRLRRSRQGAGPPRRLCLRRGRRVSGRRRRGPPRPGAGHRGGADVEACAAATAAEIAALVAGGATVRDRETGVPRPVRPGDVAILFRTRESHREFEDALARVGLPSYVYKGLGFFDADEIKDLLALLWYLAEPASDLRAAAFLRSRFVRLSDEALRRLAPGLADGAGRSRAACRRGAAARRRRRRARLAAARASSARWRARADRMPPAELVDLVLHESRLRRRAARAALASRRARTSRNSGRCCGASRTAATPPSGASPSHLDRLAVGDESNASLDATNAVNLMTVHAAKGLEFPVVFVVNLARGTGNRRDYIRIGTEQSVRRRVGGRGRLHLRIRRGRPGARARGDQAPALRGADAGARPPVSEFGAEGWPHRAGPRQPGRGAAAGAPRRALPPRPRGCRPSGAPPRAVCTCSACACALPTTAAGRPRLRVRLGDGDRGGRRSRCRCRAARRAPRRRRRGFVRDACRRWPSSRPRQPVRIGRSGTVVHRLLQALGTSGTTSRTTCRRWLCSCFGPTRPWRSPIATASPRVPPRPTGRLRATRRFAACTRRADILHEVPFALRTRATPWSRHHRLSGAGLAGRSGRAGVQDRPAPARARRAGWRSTRRWRRSCFQAPTVRQS